MLGGGERKETGQASEQFPDGPAQGKTQVLPVQRRRETVRSQICFRPAFGAPSNNGDWAARVSS